MNLLDLPSAPQCFSTSCLQGIRFQHLQRIFILKTLNYKKPIWLYHQETFFKLENFNIFVFQANYRSVHESSQKLGACNSVKAVQRVVDIHRRSHFGGNFRCFGLQHHQVHRQTFTRNHQKCFFSQRTKS